MDDVTLGELARRMDLLHTDVKEMRSAVVEHDDLKSVANAWHLSLTAMESTSALKFQTLDTRVTSLESALRWVVMTVLAMVIAAVVGAVIVGPFN